jgi:hypothetical protein
VAVEVLARTGDSSPTQAGVPPGLRRTGEIRTRMMPVFDRFVPVLERALPAAYLFSDADTALASRLRRHGIQVTRADGEASAVEELVVDSIVRSARPIQGHNEVRIAGHWRLHATPLPPNMSAVRTGQRLGRLAALLLDPESDDGFATWNAFDAELRVGAPFPVLRVPASGQATR